MMSNVNRVLMEILPANRWMLVKHDKRRKKKAVACNNCGWQGHEKDLVADQDGYEHCPSCEYGDSTEICDDDTREDL